MPIDKKRSNSLSMSKAHNSTVNNALIDGGNGDQQAQEKPRYLALYEKYKEKDTK